ncbi:MAG: hypothetical protein K2Z81_01725 [Cyanobacteria bacterium]|nr:hypothetical protein [Cyanobacteriota bacterium]
MKNQRRNQHHLPVSLTTRYLLAMAKVRSELRGEALLKTAIDKACPQQKACLLAEQEVQLQREL